MEIQTKFSTKLRDHFIGQSVPELSFLSEPRNQPLLETGFENTLSAPLNSMTDRHCCQHLSHGSRNRNVSVSSVFQGDHQNSKNQRLENAAGHDEVSSQLQLIPRSQERDLRCVSLPQRPTVKRKKNSSNKSKLHLTKGSKLRQKGLYWTAQFRRASNFKNRTPIPISREVIVGRKKSLATTKTASIIDQIMDVGEISASKNALFLEEEKTLNESYLEILTLLSRSTSMKL